MKMEEVFRKLKPLIGKKADQLWVEWLIGDQVVKQMIELDLRLTLAGLFGAGFDQKQILLEPPPRDRAFGEYCLGPIYYGDQKFYRFGLREKEWIQHVGVFGRSGSGKTNVGFLILLNWIYKDKPFLVFDWKRNYRDLLSLPYFRELRVFTVGRDIAPFFFNPLIPPSGTLRTVWLKKLIEIMCHAYFLGEGVAYLLQEALDSVYHEHSGDGTWPNMADVRDHLISRKPKGREGAWMESALRAVGVLCYGEIGRVLNSPNPTNLQAMLDQRVILELDALTNSDKTFFIESLLLWIHHYRLAEGSREIFKHGIVIEEAHHVLLRKKQETTGEESITDVILREIRELGESCVVLDQHPSLISKPALGNTYTTICMNLKHRGDIAMIADSILLDTEKARYLGRLEVGWAMVKLQGRWFHPFLVKFPFLKVEKGSVTDADIIEYKKAGNTKPRTQDFALWVRNTFSEMKELTEELNRDLRSYFLERRDIPPFPRGRGDISPIPGSGKSKDELQVGAQNTGETSHLTKEEKLFLDDVRSNELSSASNRYISLGVTARIGHKLKRDLLEKGLLREEDVHYGRGRIKLLELSQRARRLLGIKEEGGYRHGSLEHRFYIERAAKVFAAKDFKVRKEFPIGGGKTVDVVAEKGGERIAIEVETGKSNPKKNVEKCLEAGFKNVVLVPTNKETQIRLNELVRQAKYKNVVVLKGL